MRPSRADITEYRGCEDADVVICQALLEHVADTPAAFAGLASILKKDGVALLFAPSKNALYARVNLLLPESLKRKLLRLLYPELADKSGFPGRYHRCTLSEFEEMAHGQGLDVVQKRAYYYSAYFSFFAPLHVLWRVWHLGFLSSVARAGGRDLQHGASQKMRMGTRARPDSSTQAD